MSKKRKTGEDSVEAQAQRLIDIMPQGSLLDWDGDEWQVFDITLAQASEDVQDLVWEEIERRDTREVQKQSTYDMTEDEWTVYQYEMMGWTDDEEPAKATKDSAKASTDPLKDCTCSGPGSKDPKWPAHITTCKCYDGPAPTYGKQCTHKRQEVELTLGLSIYASSSSDVGYEVDESIGFGVYLDSGWTSRNKVTVLMDPMPGFDWSPSTESVHPAVYLTCPDRAAPHVTPDDMLTLADQVYELIAEGVKVETGCIGGHGRTGTFLACMLASGGVDPLAAIQQVWEDYCIQAIEDIKQVEYIVEVYETRYGKEWKENQDYMALWSECMHKNFSPPKPTYTAPPSPVAYIGKGISTVQSYLGKGGVH